MEGTGAGAIGAYGAGGIDPVGTKGVVDPGGIMSTDVKWSGFGGATANAGLGMKGPSGTDDGEENIGGGPMGGCERTSKAGSVEVENGGGKTAAEAGRWDLFVVVGRNTTGAVADRLVMKPGAKGRAVLLRTLLEGCSGNGVSVSGAGGVRIVTGAVAGLGATGGEGIAMLTAE